MVQEKRKSPRKASLTRCSVDRLFKHGNPVPSRVLNYSSNGLMIELDYPLPPGDALAVTFGPGTEEASVFGCTRCIGMVRWCAPQHGAIGGMYGIGMELASRYVRKSWS